MLEELVSLEDGQEVDRLVEEAQGSRIITQLISHHHHLVLKHLQIFLFLFRKFTLLGQSGSKLARSRWGSTNASDGESVFEKVRNVISTRTPTSANSFSHPASG